MKQQAETDIRAMVAEKVRLIHKELGWAVKKPRQYLRHDTHRGEPTYRSPQPTQTIHRGKQRHRPMNKIQTTMMDYEGFVEKFKPKKTTDDCYTPQVVYDEVLRFVGELTDLTGREIVRPFWPGGDYERYDYPENCIVVDNPPFSNYAKIVRFYLAHGIDFFLFAPALTQFVANAPVCYIVCMADVTYENGAVVRTSFTTSLVPDTRVWVNGTLYKRLKEVQPAGPGKKKQTVYPANVLTSATMGKIAARGVDFKVGADQCCFIRRTDNMPKDKSLFGAGFLLSERAAAERAVAERAAAERAAAELEDAFVIKLSERELKMVELLNKQEAAK